MFDESDNVRKINTINRRLFIITAAKILVFFWTYIKTIFSSSQTK